MLLINRDLKIFNFEEEREHLYNDYFCLLQCFNGHNVLQGTGVSDSGFKYDGFKKISVFIVNKLIQKICFAREKGHTFVMKEDFVQGLAKTYGNNTHISIQGFYKLHKKIFGTKCEMERDHHHGEHAHGHGDGHVSWIYFFPLNLKMLKSQPFDGAN